MKSLSLRIRVFLFFCLAALGSLAIVGGALWAGFRQLADADAASAFVTTAIIAGLGITGLVAGIWLLFDENVSKPVESIAASLRVRAHVEVTTPIDVSVAKYLGDLAPAASAMGAILGNIAQTRSEKSERKLAEITTQRDQLVEILSDLPIATILASSDHKIVLYDGQAAAIMERTGTARLKTSVFDYFDNGSILYALGQMENAEVSRVDITIKSLSGDVHAGHIRHFGKRAGYTLMLEPLEPDSARPLTYDFDLLASTGSATLRDTPLRDLVYVVFDSETTGLDPATDEVVQLGAVRVVNGKIIAGEAFDTLVDPGMKMPKQSTEVHGITNAMVADAPPFQDVCPAFHNFAKGAVLVAHNAAFDMAFLHKQTAKGGAPFDHPVLDTVLMSAAVFGGSAVHTLDAICARLDIDIPASQRHTAMGDAIATARALTAMIGILDGIDVKSFGDLQQKMEKHRRVLRS